MRNLTLVCTALAIISGIISAKLWRELRTERELTAEWRSQSHTTAPSPAMPAQPVPDSAPAPSQPKNVGGTPRLELRMANPGNLMKDPEYRGAELARLRMTIAQDYPGLVEELRLTPEDARKLFDLLAEAQMEKRSVSVVPTLGEPQDPAAVQNSIREMMRARQEIDRGRNESLGSLLGSGRHELFRQYEEERPARNRVNELGRTLTSIGQPLSDSQMRPLTKAFAAVQRMERDEMENRANRMQPADLLNTARIAATELAHEADVDRQSESNRRTIEAVQPLLNAPQLEILKADLDLQLARSRAAARIRREQSEGQGKR